MDRTKLLALVFFAIASAAVAQQQSNPQTPEDAFSTRELIAWSQLQTPQPMPEPLPPRESVPQPEQPRDQQYKTPSDPRTEQPAQWFTGKIVKVSGAYLLQVTGNASYRLQAETELGQYESQSVRVLGDFNSEVQAIRVMRVQSVS
jgi:hypothetical protein